MQLFSLARRLRARRRSRGQSLVEFAVILPVMLLFLAAVLDLGRIFYANITLHNVAREGAFQASQTPTSFVAGQPCNTTTNLITCRVQLESKGSMVQVGASNITVSCSVSGCPKAANSRVTVGVSGTFQLLTPILGFVFGGQTLQLSSAATSQIEYFNATAVATMPPGPVAVAHASTTSGNLPLTVNFDGTGSSGSPTGWEWNFGDGSPVVTDQATVSHTFTAAGTYAVVLKVVNLAGEDTDVVTITVVDPAPTATASGSAAPTASPAPVCQYPPNVIGLSPSAANTKLVNAGFVVESYGDLTTGQKNKIQAQNPDHTTCKLPGTTIILHFRPG
jgi:PKD repeat protein